MVNKLTERVMRECIRKMEKHGIEEWIIGIRDPDSDADWFHRNGSATFQVGACRMIEARVMKEMHEEFDQQDRNKED